MILLLTLNFVLKIIKLAVHYFIKHSYYFHYYFIVIQLLLLLVILKFISFEHSFAAMTTFLIQILYQNYYMFNNF
jgi:hypothetical protein